MGKKLSKKFLNWLNIILKINLTAYRTKKLQKAWNYYSLSLIKIDVQQYYRLFAEWKLHILAIIYNNKYFFKISELSL